MTLRLLYFVDHPIQYQAPLLRLIAGQPDIDLHVVFQNGAGATEYFDEGFGTSVQWDVSLLDGYKSEVISDNRLAASRINGFDAVWLHGWQGWRMQKILRHAWHQNVPVLMRGENTDAAMPDGKGLRGAVKRKYLGRIFSRCAAFLCIGSENRAYYLRRGVDPRKLFDVPYAVDNARFRSLASDADSVLAIRSDLNLSPDRPIILFAGKFQARKNATTLIEAFTQIDHECLGKPYLILVGDGEERAKLEKLASGAKNIRIIGFKNQSELPALYSLADLFVLASDREPWGLAVNEAMNCNCAIIASDQCGCAADLVSDRCGRIVPAGEAAPLARAISEILIESEGTKAMGRAAARKIQDWSFDHDLTGLRDSLNFLFSEPPTA